MTSTPASLTLVAAQAADADYLYTLIESTMRVYVEDAHGNWPESEARNLIRTGIENGALKLVLAGGIPIGAIQTTEHDTHVQLDELFIAPEHQGHGHGTQLIQAVIRRAQSLSVPVRLRVLRPNPARNLYERLGFTVTHSTDHRHFMEFPAPQRG